MRVLAHPRTHLLDAKFRRTHMRSIADASSIAALLAMVVAACARIVPAASEHA
jgi:hypothetical protein